MPKGDFFLNSHGNNKSKKLWISQIKETEYQGFPWKQQV